MLRDQHEKAIAHFNNNQPDKMYHYIHDDIQIMRLKTGEVVVDGLEQLKKINQRYMDEGKIKFKLTNSIEFDNILISFQELVGLNTERISITEFVDDKVKRTWITQFKKEKRK